MEYQILWLFEVTVGFFSIYSKSSQWPSNIFGRVNSVYENVVSSPRAGKYLRRSALNSTGCSVPPPTPRLWITGILLSSPLFWYAYLSTPRSHIYNGFLPFNPFPAVDCNQLRPNRNPPTCRCRPRHNHLWFIVLEAGTGRNDMPVEDRSASSYRFPCTSSTYGHCSIIHGLGDGIRLVLAVWATCRMR
jgi:hypothetical protein